MHRKPRETTKPSQAKIYRLALETRVSINTIRKWMAGERVQPAIKLALERALEKEGHHAG
jgi:hypothetical protein